MSLLPFVNFVLISQATDNCDLAGLSLVGHPLIITYCTFTVALQLVPRVFQAKFVNIFLFFLSAAYDQ